MTVNHWERGDFYILSDLGALDQAWLISALKSTYWASANSPDVIWKSIENSVPYGLFSKDRSQVGFARLVTDSARFAWVSDVYIDASVRDQGLGKWLMSTIVNDPRFATIHLWMLATTDDAHTLYELIGFKRSEATELRSQLMHLSRPKS